MGDWGAWNYGGALGVSLDEGEEGDAACSERLSSDLLRGARWWLH